TDGVKGCQLRFGGCDWADWDDWDVAGDKTEIIFGRLRPYGLTLAHSLRHQGFHKCSLCQIRLRLADPLSLGPRKSIRSNETAWLRCRKQVPIRFLHFPNHRAGIVAQI